MPEPATPSSVTLATIRQAAERLRGQVLRTPCSRSVTLSEITGATRLAEVREPAVHRFLQGTRRLQQALRARRGRARIAASLPCRRATMRRAWRTTRSVSASAATIVMPKNTPYVKVKHTEGHDARVILEGRTHRGGGRLRDAARDGAEARLHPPLRRPAGDRRPGHDRDRDAGGRARHRLPRRTGRRRRTRERHGGRGARA